MRATRSWSKYNNYRSLSTASATTAKPKPHAARISSCSKSPAPSAAWSASPRSRSGSTASTAAPTRATSPTRSATPPATRARKQAAQAKKLAWAYQHNLIASNPMARVARGQPVAALPRGLPRAQVEKILAVLPSRCKRDRLLFRLIIETGLRIGEALVSISGISIRRWMMNTCGC